jgi:ABC-2 type transport system permease protein
MKKLLLIGMKDLTLAFRDRAALVLMLLAPFVVTAGLGVVTGRLSGGNRSGLGEIQVVIVNQDQKALGDALAAVFESPELADLIAPMHAADAALARRQVSDDEAAVAVIIPPGFTDSVFDPQSGVVKVEVHTNPGSPLSAGIVQAIVEAFLRRVQAGPVIGAVTVARLVESGRVAPEAAAAAAQAFGQQPVESTGPGIAIRRVAESRAEPAFDILAVLAPGMALMFLMYTVSNGGRSILSENAAGTLPRLLVAPTSPAQVLGGKVLGIFLTGSAQVGILIAASTVLFGMRWGDPAGVVLLVAGAALGATGWGVLLAALAKSPAQVMSLGSALMLVFAILSGSFGFNFALPGWLQLVARLTPNKWGIDGFAALGAGATLGDILPHISALIVMGTALFVAAVLLFRRQGLARR